MTRAKDISRLITDADFAGTLTVGDLTASSLNGGQFGGRRNIIINGAMNVAQRGTSTTGSTAGDFITDRFKLGVTSLGTWTMSQATDAPSGFSHSAKIECTTADASPASTDLVYFYTRLEGQDLQHLKFGTANAETVTISFWMKSTKTGVVTLNWRNQDNSRAIGKDLTISSANTWEYHTATFLGDTSAVFTNDNGWSASVEILLNGGTNYTSGSTPTVWTAVSNTNGTRGGGTTLALGANTSESWQISGLQLEVGSVATPFEHRSFGEELALCQRYYWKATTEAFGLAVSGFSAAGRLANPVPMRVAGTVSNSSFAVNSGSAGTVVVSNGTVNGQTIYNGAGNWTVTALVVFNGEISGEL